MYNFLDDTKNIYQEQGVTNMIEYFVKIVPTTYSEEYGTPIKTNQFSAVYYSQRMPSFLANPFRSNGSLFFFLLDLIESHS
ncbi:hypothetical protein M1146_04430 [Patescibacteria group bacterium]|nr:hypothetical protein [Patescibacteria group bacterium]